MVLGLNKKLSNVDVSKRSRIKKLLMNPKLGQKILGKIMSDWGLKAVHSNCYGTVAYVYGENYEAFNLDGKGQRPFSFPVKGRPGYMDSSSFSDWINMNYEVVDSPIPGDIVTLRAKDMGQVKEHWNIDKMIHSAIYLGRDLYGKLTVFEQHRRGAIFQGRDTSLEENCDDYEIEYYGERK